MKVLIATVLFILFMLALGMIISPGVDSKPKVVDTVVTQTPEPNKEK